MTRSLVFALALVVVTACPADEGREQLAATAQRQPPSPPKEELPPLEPVLARLENASATAVQDAFVDGGSLRAFGAVPAGATTGYLPFEHLSVGDGVFLDVGGAYRAAAWSGAKARLPSGRYTLKLRLEGERALVDATRETGPPTPDELAQAFLAAEESLSPSLLRAVAFRRRAETLRCGAQHGATGRARLALYVAPSGRPGGVTAQGALAGTPLEDCLKDALSRWRFPRYTGAMPPPFVVDVALSEP